MAYHDDLILARVNARQEFFEKNPLYKPIVDAVRTVLPNVVIAIEHECRLINYTKSLLASFVRTAFVSIDLIESSELIEATALNRKQIELLARLHELDSKSYESLSGKTPNVKHLLSKVKNLYSIYSESAHSATYAAHSLLGFYEGRERKHSLLFPEFTENTEIIFQNWLSIFFEFTLWALTFKEKNIAGYSRSTDEQSFMNIFQLYAKSGLKDKFR